MADQGYGGYGYGGTYSPSGFAPPAMPSPGGGGGYTNSQESPAMASKGRASASQTFIPVTIRQLHDAKQAHGDDIFRIDGQEISLVSVLGHIRQLQETSTHISFELDDPTSSINVRVWIDEEQQQINENDRKWRREKCYVRVTGNLRSFNDQRSLVGVKVRAIEDFNEMTYHYAEVIRNHVKSTRTLMPQDEGELVDGNMMHGGSYAAGGAYAPAYGGQQGNTVTMAELIKTIVNGNPTSQGANLGFIMEGLRSRGVSATPQEVSGCISELLEAGLLYSTVDDEHWKACQ